jgi:hypothetical protein
MMSPVLVETAGPWVIAESSVIQRMLENRGLRNVFHLNAG